MPEVQSMPLYQLTTHDPEEDLKRWLLMPNESLDGVTEKRTEKRNVGFFRDKRYTSDILVFTLLVAIDEIGAESAHIDSLEGYLQHKPYWSSPPLQKVGRSDFLEITAVHMEGVERRKLGHALLRAVTQLDLLRDRAERLCGSIGEYKEYEAVDGD